VTTYGTSAVTRSRRTKVEIESIDNLIVTVLREEHPATVRSVFYRLVSLGAVPKDEARGYRAVQRRTLTLRRTGRIPYGWIADGTRWRIKPASWESVDLMLEDAAASYRRALWHDQPIYVEVWAEKDAIAGVVAQVTEPWDVPLLVARGYSSETFLHSSAQALAAAGRPAVVYQLGDHDPSGVDSWRHIQDKLREFAPGADITFERLAVTPDQIVEHRLLTRPTKATDSRARRWQGGSVEVDALAPSVLRRIVESAITSHIDVAALRLTEACEAADREFLEGLAASRGGAR